MKPATRSTQPARFLLNKYRCKIHIFVAERRNGFALCGIRGPVRLDKPVRLNNSGWLCPLEHGRDMWMRIPDEVRPREPVCKHCQRIWFLQFDSQTTPEADERSTFKGDMISPVDVREIPGRMFRVKGERDIYTVTVPQDKGLANVCTCMAAKTNPTVACKHQVAVVKLCRLGNESRGEG